MANSFVATQVKTPGVYIEELRMFPPSVAAVSTAIPAFIGHTQIAKEKVDDDLINRPKRITSLLDYIRYYGGPQNEENILIRITEENKKVALNAEIPDGAARSRHIMYYALQTYFDNGGGPCWVVSAGKYLGFDTVIPPAPLQKGLSEIAKIDEVTLLVFPEEQGLSNVDYATVQSAALRQCFELQDRFSLMSLHTIREITNNHDISQDAMDYRGLTIGASDDHRKYGAAYYPNIDTIFDYAYDEATPTIVHRVDNQNGPLDGIHLIDLKPSQANQNSVLYNQAKSAIQAIPCRIPPSAAMAGVYAAVDSSRGVWKAPANVGVTSVVKPTVVISDKDQENLNIDPDAGKSINAIRTFTGRGTLVWGARTLTGNDNEWRYIPVRRFFNMVEESVKKATSQFVFEPNDRNTWVRVKSMIDNFLTLQWRAGALAGAVTEDAFYVHVGLGETMTSLDILEGRMIVEIGMAVVRPAEFIILQFMHKMQES